MGRAPCCDKDGLKKGPWTPEEDQMLIDYIQKHGYGSWRTLPKNAGLARCGKSCRLRWTNYLRPDIKRGRFSFEEEETIIQLHSILGNKWSAIAARLPGRTDNEIKNYWNTHIRKRLLRMGIDPVTHTPRLDLLDLSSLLANPALFNPTSQFDVSKLLGIGQIVNPELLKIATNLLSSNTQVALHDQGLFQFTDPIQEVPSCTTSSPQMFYSDQSQFVQFQPNDANLWQADGMHCNYLPGTATTTTSTHMNHENLEHSVPQYVSSDDNANFYLVNNQDCNLSTNSVLSTPLSSPRLPTQLNSSSANYINSSSTTTTATEDERDSYCSELFKFQIPGLLDVSEFLYL